MQKHNTGLWRLEAHGLDLIWGSNALTALTVGLPAVSKSEVKKPETVIHVTQLYTAVPYNSVEIFQNFFCFYLTKLP